MRTRPFIPGCVIGLWFFSLFFLGSCHKKPLAPEPVTIEFWTTDSEQDRINVQKSLAQEDQKPLNDPGGFHRCCGIGQPYGFR